MVHYVKGIRVNMYCSHPDLQNNDCSTVGCDGKCENCIYGKAEMTIAACMALLEEYQEVKA